MNWLLVGIFANSLIVGFVLAVVASEFSGWLAFSLAVTYFTGLLIAMLHGYEAAN